MISGNLIGSIQQFLRTPVDRLDRSGLTEGRISTRLTIVRAYTFVRGFCHEYFFKVFFFELRGGLQRLQYLHKVVCRSPLQRTKVLYVIRKKASK